MEATMICKKCAATMPDTAKFCPKCGVRTEEAANRPTGSPMKACPRCGAENPEDAKFCRADGYNFHQEPPSGGSGAATGAAGQVAPESGSSPKTGEIIIDDTAWPPPRGGDKSPQAKGSVPPSSGPRRSSKRVVSIVAIIVVVLLLGAGGYVYFSGYFAVKPEKFQVLLTNEIQTKAAAVSAAVDGNWVVTLTGAIQNEGQREEVVKAVKAHKEVKDVVDQMTVKKGAIDIQFDINQELADGGLATVQAMVDENMIVTLTGFVSTKEARDKAVELARKNKDVKDVVDKTAIQDEGASSPAEPGPAQPAGPVAGPPPGGQGDYDPAKLEGEINRELRNAGLGNVTAAVDSKRVVTLKGSVRSGKDKQRALGIARGFPGVQGVKDMVFTIATTR